LTEISNTDTGAPERFRTGKPHPGIHDCTGEKNVENRKDKKYGDSHRLGMDYIGRVCHLGSSGSAVLPDISLCHDLSGTGHPVIPRDIPGG